VSSVFALYDARAEVDFLHTVLEGLDNVCLIGFCPTPLITVDTHVVRPSNLDDELGISR